MTVKEFVSKHKKKALAILAGVATIGAAVAGEKAFRDKYEGIAPASEDGLAIIKHILSGSEKKLGYAGLGKVTACGCVDAQRIKGYQLI